MNDDVLILEAHMRQSLMAARSLGRRGLRVALAESYAEWNNRWPVPAFGSRYVNSTFTLPNHLTDPERFTSELLEHLRRSPTRVLIPVSDGLVGLLRPHREEISRLSSIALAGDEALTT